MKTKKKPKVNLKKPNLYQQLKKHKVKVCLDFGDSEIMSVENAKLKIFLDGTLAYSTKANVLKVRQVESHKFNIKKFKFEQYDYYTLAWKSDSARQSFIKWGRNFRSWSDIQKEVSNCFSKLQHLS